jgi:hypothetical protein
MHTQPRHSQTCTHTHTACPVHSQTHSQPPYHTSTHAHVHTSQRTRAHTHSDTRIRSHLHTHTHSHSTHRHPEFCISSWSWPVFQRSVRTQDGYHGVLATPLWSPRLMDPATGSGEQVREECEAKSSGCWVSVTSRAPGPSGQVAFQNGT